MVQPPIIVIESTADVRICPTLARAGQALEATDVKEGVYRAFDSAGTPLELAVTSWIRVEVREVPGASPRPDELAGMLRGLLRARGYIEADDMTLSLDALAQLCSAFALG